MHRAGGYSLVELLVATTIAGILAAMAGPSFVSLLRDERISSEINLLLADVQLARFEAVKRNRDVVLCRSADGKRCRRGPRRSDWSIGWIVYVNRDGDSERDPGEPLLRARPGLPEGMRLYFNQWWRVIYHGDGSARSGTFTLCDHRGPGHGRALTLYYTGRPRVTDTRADGEPLDCG